MLEFFWQLYLRYDWRRFVKNSLFRLTLAVFFFRGVDVFEANFLRPYMTQQDNTNKAEVYEI